jgi:GNAT superfamily N-acetyltransferase
MAGCVVLRGEVPDQDAGECKRLYVRPAFRRLGIAEALMTALEDFARRAGVQWVYLDTHDTFAASIRLYQARGYERCERYNDNPQATLFFRKRLS